MARFHYAKRALDSLTAQYDYISQHNPSAARNVLAEVDYSCGLIADFPQIGREVPGTTLRYLVTRKYRYRIIYRIVGTSVEIRDVLHPRQR